MYLQSQLLRQFPPGIRSTGAALFDAGRRAVISGTQKEFLARVQESRQYEVELWRDKAEIHADCECPVYEATGLCKHLWAGILAADARSYLLGVMGSGPVRLVNYIQ